MISNQRSYYDFGISLCMHLIILLSIGFYGNLKVTTFKMYSHENIMLSSYITTDNLLTPVKENTVNNKMRDLINTKKKLEPVSKHHVNKPNSALLKISSMTQKAKAVESLPLSKAQGKGEDATALIALLHKAIQEKQQYPISAQQLEREGKVTIMFLIFKNGTVSNIRVVRSSGTESLDQAALSAVNEAAPFKLAAQYLSNMQEEYSIDVVFELTG